VACLPPTVDLFQDTGEREFRQVQTQGFQHANEDRLPPGLREQERANIMLALESRGWRVAGEKGAAQLLMSLPLFDSKAFFQKLRAGATNTIPYGKNDSGQIVGYYPDVTYGFAVSHGFQANGINEGRSRVQT
jgi:hypothetical protein